MTELELLKKALQREKKARKAAEQFLENKSLELYEANQQLQKYNAELEELVQNRTKELDKIAKLVSESPSPIIRCDPQGKIIYFNNAAKEFINKLGELEDGTPDEIRQSIRESFQSNTRNYFEVDFQHSHYLIYLTPIEEEDYVNLYVVDITQIKSARKELQDSETRYRQIVESANDIIFKSTPEGVFTYVNPTVIRLLEYSLEELIGKSFYDLVLDEDRDYAQVIYENDNAQKGNHEFRVRSKFGKIIWVNVQVHGVYEEEEIKEFTTLARDVTERKRAEALVKLNEDKYRMIIENMELGLLEVDLNNKVMRADRRFVEMTGYAEEDLIGKIPDQILLRHGEEAELMEEQRERRVKGETSVYEVKVKKKDGSDMWMLISGAPLYDENGEMLGSIGIHLDTTDRKNIEHELIDAKIRAEESSKSKENFLANMSHEIRTPINAIMGLSSLLEESLEGPKEKKYLESIIRSSNNLLVIINDILDFSKIEAGEMVVETIDFDLEEVLESVMRMFVPKAEEKGLSLRLETDIHWPSFFKGDPYRLTQVLVNLVGNAIKFTEMGQVCLKVKQEDLDPDTSHFQFEIIDTGVGISEESMEVIFDGFKQAHGGITRKFGGTGLGLSITKKIVELFDGELTVHSQLDKGSTFRVDVIFKRGDVIEKEEPKTDNDYSRLNGAKVILAEDNEYNTLLATTILNQEGVEVFHAHDGNEVLQYLEVIPDVELILMDIQMPERNGVETTKYIRNNLKLDIPIIALTANALKGDNEKFLSVGMDEYVSKPFTKEHLFQKMLKCLGEEVQESIQKEGSEPDQLYDLSALEAMSAGDDGFVTKMIGVFLEHVPQSLAAIELAIEQKDIEGLKTHSHKILGTIRTINSARLANLLEETENMVDREEHSDLIVENAKASVQLLKQLISALEAR